MNIPVSLRVEVSQGSSGNSLVAVMSLLNPDGTVLDSSESYNLAPGTILEFGPFSIGVNHEGTFHSEGNQAEKTPVQPPSTAGLSKGQLPGKAGR